MKRLTYHFIIRIISCTHHYFIEFIDMFEESIVIIFVGVLGFILSYMKSETGPFIVSGIVMIILGVLYFYKYMLTIEHEEYKIKNNKKDGK